MRMSTEIPQTFLHRISPSILREIPVDLDDNLDLLEPFNKALFSPKKKKKIGSQQLHVDIAVII